MMRKESAGSTGGTEVALDATQCLTLQQILQAFNSHISEEHAWALFYQASRCFQKCLDEGTAYYLPTELSHVVLHKDGTVHPRTLLHTGAQFLEKVMGMASRCDKEPSKLSNSAGG
ncbi:jg23578 [Pararge aegeria aegeria]|uniref:Jg23578 protein n=1 Tax=Pararge aegeria aegeria TaxID=348720 RepID=A0A8S4RPA2_9NEOP|nr:jg23578 [Pararge aegeria aegeria]